ncbi:DUF1187 family protein [Salmonella enterica]
MYRITAVINKAGGAPVSWTFYSGRRMTLEQCETILSRDREAGRYNGFRVTLTEFSCERVDDGVRFIQQTV